MLREGCKQICIFKSGVQKEKELKLVQNVHVNQYFWKVFFTTRNDMFQYYSICLVRSFRLPSVMPHDLKLIQTQPLKLIKSSKPKLKAHYVFGEASLFQQCCLISLLNLSCYLLRYSTHSSLRDNSLILPDLPVIICASESNCGLQR